MNKEKYKEIDLDSIKKLLSELVIKAEKDGRLIKYACGKQGVINAEKAFYEAIGLTTEQVKEKIEHLQTTLDDNKYYYFDGLKFNIV